MKLPRSGLQYDAELDYAFAAHWWGIEWLRFAELDGDEQAFLVAVYLADRQIEAALAWKREQERKRMN